MNKALRFILPVLTLLIVIGSLPGVIERAFAQDDISFTASVDRTTISSDDLLTLQLTLSGNFSGSSQPQLPPLDGFTVTSTSQSSQFSFVNGKVSSQMTFTYRLRATKTGDLTIPSISTQANGQTCNTNSINVKVTPGNAPASTQPGTQTPADTSIPDQLTGQDFYVEADVDNQSPMVGQQIIYRFRFYQAINLFTQPSLDWPGFAGFLHYDLSPNNQYYQQAAGRQYLVTEVRKALFPTATGEVTITPAILTVPGDFFSRGVELQTASVKVDVQSLPSGAPDDFAGTVGQFEISAEVEPSESRVNEPVALTVRINGTGNVSLLPDPAEDMETSLASWRIFDPQVTTNVGQNGTTIQGEKVFEFPLVPKTDGELTIPSFSLSFFDPVAGEYQRVETSPLTVSVALGDPQTPGINGVGKQDVVALGGDIRHIKPAPTAIVTSHASVLCQPIYWVGWIMGLLGVFGVLWWDRRRRHLESNLGYARSQRARGVARKKLSEARKIAQNNQDAAYAAVASAITSYLGDKFNLSAAGLTRDTTRQALATNSVPENEIDRLLDCLDWADSGRFAPAAAGRDLAGLIDEAEGIITELEERIA